MKEIAILVNDFLAQERVAVIGVSRSLKKTGDRIYDKFKNNGYEVFPINLHTSEYKGEKCYASVKDIPGSVGAAVLILNPEATGQVIHECVEAGIKHVWMHFIMGYELPDEVTAYCKENNVNLIPSACPMMYLKPDIGHLCMRVLGRFIGFVPG